MKQTGTRPPFSARCALIRSGTARKNVTLRNSSTLVQSALPLYAIPASIHRAFSILHLTTLMSAAFFPVRETDIRAAHEQRNYPAALSARGAIFTRTCRENRALSRQFFRTPPRARENTARASLLSLGVARLFSDARGQLVFLVACFCLPPVMRIYGSVPRSFNDSSQGKWKTQARPLENACGNDESRRKLDVF